MAFYLDAMRRSTLLVVLISPMLAGCAATPASLGLTGRRPVAPPPQASDADLGMPGVYEGGGGLYAPSLVPHTGGGRYFGAD
jgi:hypothetical protein